MSPVRTYYFGDTWGHPWSEVDGAEEEEEGEEQGEGEGEDEGNEQEESGEDGGEGEEEEWEEWGGVEGGAVEELRESMQAMLVNATPPQLEDDDEEEEEEEEEDEEDEWEEGEEEEDGEGEEVEAGYLEESVGKLQSTPLGTSSTPVAATASAGGERYHQHPGERVTPLLNAESPILHGTFPGYREEEAGSEGKGRGPRRRLEDEMAALETRGGRAEGEAGEGDRGEAPEAMAVQQVMRALGFSGLLFLAHAVLSAVLLARLKAHVHASAGAVFDRRILPRLHRWLQVTALPFVTITTCTVTTNRTGTTDVNNTTIGGTSRVSAPAVISSRGSRVSDQISATHLRQWHAWLRHVAGSELCAVRTGQLFDIIVDYPDSTPALLDLKDCLENGGSMGGEGLGMGGESSIVGGNVYGRLVASFRTALANRLLTAGASTADILQQYVSAIRALRLVDPSGVVLEAVSEPIRQYLRGRKCVLRLVDPSRVVVLEAVSEPIRFASTCEAESECCCAGKGKGGAIKSAADVADDVAGEAGDPGDLSLLEELSRAAEGGKGEAGGSGEGEEEGAGLGEDLAAAYAAVERWQPDPIDADPWQSSGQAQRARDIVRVLAGVFGSREVLLGEYRGMLAERLVGRMGYDTDRDVRTLELLKACWRSGLLGALGRTLTGTCGHLNCMLAERLMGRAGYDTDRDVRTLELLKLRFGESNLHACEVMLRDMADSKRINGNVKAAMRQAREEARDLAEAREESVDTRGVGKGGWGGGQRVVKQAMRQAREKEAQELAEARALVPVLLVLVLLLFLSTKFSTSPPFPPLSRMVSHSCAGQSVVGAGRGAATAQRESRGTGGGVSGAGVSGSGVSGSGSSAWSQAHTPEHLVVRGMASFSTPPDRPGRGGEGGEGGGGGGIVGGGGASQWFTPDSFASSPPAAAAAAQAPPGEFCEVSKQVGEGRRSGSLQTRLLLLLLLLQQQHRHPLWFTPDSFASPPPAAAAAQAPPGAPAPPPRAARPNLLSRWARLRPDLRTPTFSGDRSADRGQPGNSARTPGQSGGGSSAMGGNRSTGRGGQGGLWDVMDALGGEGSGDEEDEGEMEGGEEEEEDGKPEEKEELLEAENLDATIVSALFWPAFQEESVRLPAPVTKLMEEYSTNYATLKAPRKLQWKANLGDGDADAAAAAAAGEGAGLGGLRGDGEGEDMVAGGELLIGDEDEEEEGGGMVASLEAQRKQESAVHESFITGMLTTFDGLPIERIHNMLKMFVSDPPYDRSLAQLHAFLGVLVAQEKLELRDGLYRKKK
ncbi:unnamed protein product [Closterium sp. Naga37s-1]|nr:unnamed protein product [Closterium sp. Naga37s-1]